MAQKHRKGRFKTTPEHWTKMLRATMETPAWRALSSASQALYPWLKFEWKGPDANNNGKIRLSVRQAADKLGVNPNTAARAFHDLQAKGFIVQTEAPCLGLEGAAKAPAFEVTELKMPGAVGDGRKLFLQWEEGKDYPVARIATNNPKGLNGRKKSRVDNEDNTVFEMKTERIAPVSEIRKGRHNNYDGTAKLTPASVSAFETSLSYHPSDAVDGARPFEGQAQPSACDGAVPIGEIINKVVALARSNR